MSTRKTIALRQIVSTAIHSKGDLFAPIQPSHATFSRSFRPGAGHAATPIPTSVAGPPPSPPTPVPSQHGDRIERRRRQAEMLQKGRELRSGQDARGNQPKDVVRRRFWDEVHVKQVGVEEGDGYQVFLDARPVRNPDKTALTIPASKPQLAHAIGLEWEVLTSAQQALKTHNIPLTSLASRAHEILRGDREAGSGGQGNNNPLRAEILKTVMRYLDTDTLLCWDPAEASEQESQTPIISPDRTQNFPANDQPPPSSLRALQRQITQPILSHLTTHLWPGIHLHPVLDDSGNSNNNKSSILPLRKQPESSKAIIKSWIERRSAYDLAGLERGVLATKSLLIAARLLVEWSEHSDHRQHHHPGSHHTITTTYNNNNSNTDDMEQQPHQIQDQDQDHDHHDHHPPQRFGILEAAIASSTEVHWQTARWGLVEDSHDVEREDLLRQLGSVVMLVCGREGEGGRERG